MFAAESASTAPDPWGDALTLLLAFVAAYALLVVIWTILVWLRDHR